MKNMFLGVIKILSAFLIVTILGNTSLCNSDINQDSLFHEINLISKNLRKLQSGNYRLNKNFNSFIKEYNNEIHSQQYINDSLFEEVLLLKNDINANIKELKKFERSLYYIRNVNANQDEKNNSRFIITIILLILIYLLTALFLFINRKKFNRHIKQSNDEIKQQYEVVNKKLDELKKQLNNKIEENQKLLNESDEQISKELNKKINDHKEHIDGVIRNISNQIEDKFKSPE